MNYTEKKPWPTWLSNLLPSWLQTLGYPYAGVGDLDDLRFKLGVGEGGKWVGFVNKGWYYFNNLEQYNYVQAGSSIISAAAGAGSQYNAISWNPSWGPIRITSTSNNYPYTQHCNSISPATNLSWYNVSGTNFYYALLPSNAYLAGVIDINNTPFASVASSGYIVGNSQYYYNQSNQTIMILPVDPTNIQVYAHCVYYSPNLYMQDFVVQVSGTLTASYSGVNGLANVSFRRGSQTATVSGVSHTNTFTNPLTGCYDGDWVVLSYYICNSFVLSDPNTIQYYTTPTTGDTFLINWETSIPDLLPEITLASNPTDSFNVNPLFSDAYRSGYLFHANPASAINTYWTPSVLNLNLDKKIILSDVGELVKLKILVLGDNNLPIPYYPINLYYTPTASAIYSTSLTTTDGRGELHALFKVAYGSTSFAVTGIVGSYSVVASATVTTLASIVTPAAVNNATANLILTQFKNPDGSFQCNVNVTSMDGLPVSGAGINVYSLQPSVFSVVSNGLNSVSTSSLSINPTVSVLNPSGYQSFGYIPQPNDKIVAISGLAQSSVVGEGL